MQLMKEHSNGVKDDNAHGLFVNSFPPAIKVELNKYLLGREFNVNTWTLDWVSKPVVAFGLTHRHLVVT